MIRFAPPTNSGNAVYAWAGIKWTFLYAHIVTKIGENRSVCVRTKNGEVRASSQTVSRIKEETVNMTAQLASQNHVNIPQSVV